MSHFVLHEGEEPQASTAPAAFEVERPRILAQVIDSKHGSKQQRPRVTADTFFDEDEVGFAHVGPEGGIFYFFKKEQQPKPLCSINYNISMMIC
jgi:hypothetical protein